MNLSNILLFSAALAVWSTDASSGHATHMRLICSDGIPTEVTLHDGTAEVQRGTRRYTLHKHSTSFTRKYVSAEATFIQDGKSIVFVSGDTASAVDCRID